MQPLEKEEKKRIAPLMCWDIFREQVNEETCLSSIHLGGFQKQSLIDYPGYLSAVIFTQGCNLRCAYCHNGQLVPLRRDYREEVITVKEVFDWLRDYSRLLDAVVITGGEPTIHRDLPGFIDFIRSLGLKIKLDTNGTNPEMLSRLIKDKALDYVAMDVKAPLSLNKYRRIVGKGLSPCMLQNIAESIEVLKNSDVEHEFRITMLKPYHTKQDLEELLENIPGRIYLQHVNMANMLSASATQSELFARNELEPILLDPECHKIR